MKCGRDSSVSFSTSQPDGQQQHLNQSHFPSRFFCLGVDDLVSPRAPPGAGGAEARRRNTRPTSAEKLEMRVRKGERGEYSSAQPNLAQPSPAQPAKDEGASQRGSSPPGYKRQPPLSLLTDVLFCVGMFHLSFLALKLSRQELKLTLNAVTRLAGKCPLRIPSLSLGIVLASPSIIFCRRINADLEIASPSGRNQLKRRLPSCSKQFMASRCPFNWCQTPPRQVSLVRLLVQHFHNSPKKPGPFNYVFIWLRKEGTFHSLRNYGQEGKSLNSNFNCYNLEII